MMAPSLYPRSSTIPIIHHTSTQSEARSSSPPSVQPAEAGISRSSNTYPTEPIRTSPRFMSKQSSVILGSYDSTLWHGAWGLRSVHWIVCLSSRFASYTLIYRFKQTNRCFGLRIPDAQLRQLRDVRSFANLFQGRTKCRQTWIRHVTLIRTLLS